MNLPQFPNAGGILGGRNAVGTAATIAAIVIFLIIIIVSLVGDGEDAQPVEVIKIERVTAEASGAPAAEAETTSTAASLVAANGAVISDPTLVDMAVEGPLPKIADDGRKAMNVYAREFDRSDPRPKVAIVIGGLGLGGAVTQSALDKLPPGITLAVTPYGSSLQGLVSTARGKGHEVVLEVPLEPYDYPDNDPGQDTLLTGQTSEENPARLRRVLAKVLGYAGLINSQGSKFLASTDEARAFLKDAAGRGLYFVETGDADKSVAREAAQAEGAPFAKGDKLLDRDPRREAVEKELAALEEAAKQRGSAIGVAGAFPTTIELVSTWAAGLEEKGIALVPVSALVVTAAVPAAPTQRSRPQPRRPAATSTKPKPRPDAPVELPTEPQPAFEEPAPHP